MTGGVPVQLVAVHPLVNQFGMSMPSSRSPVADQAYDGLVDLILTGGLRPGERTSVNLLADRLGLGRTPVKEAITRLHAEGVLEIADRSGTTLKALGPEETQQLFALRRVLEDFAASEAVRNVSDTQLLTLRALAREMADTSLCQAGTQQAAARFVRANAAFHAALVAAAGNPFLDRLYGQLQMQAQLVAYLVGRGADPGAARQRQEEHDSIVAALAARDGLALRRLLRAHADETERAILVSLGARPPSRRPSPQSVARAPALAKGGVG